MNKKEANETEIDFLERRIRQAGKRARMEAEFHDTYIVYIDDNGNMVKEYPNGEIKKIE